MRKIFAGISLSLCATSTVADVNWDKLTQQTNAAQHHQSGASNVADEKGNIFFNEDAAVLTRGDLQMAAVLMTSSQFQDSSLAKLDTDGFSKLQDKSELVMVAKSAYLFPVEPQKFALKHTFKQSFIDTAFDNDTNELKHDFRVKSKKSYSIFKKVTVGVQFQEFDFASDRSQGGMTAKQVEQYVKLHAAGKKPDLITSTVSGPDDVSDYVHGLRTINYYYAVGDGHTLHVSYKLSFLKSSWFDSLIKSQGVGRQLQGTLRSLHDVRQWMVKHS